MKKSFFDKQNHRLDKIKNLGYSYEGKIFENSLSKVLRADDTRKSILDKFEKMIFEMIESVKLIKTNINWTLPKNYRKFN